uniref:Uncharacterized protein n=1 Tax=Oryza sativa subsp. japonica TaxID=39947 RepID=Q6YU43_ORYSJ|nr:hypothetical protein [Oryza sativa Japonica Group]BAD31617.1 hypothetical protein [Oryza sativa Japonica Group]
MAILSKIRAFREDHICQYAVPITSTKNGRSTVSNVFPALESLKFRDMGAWEEWSEFKDEHFPQLKYLSIVRCAKLTVLPNFTSGPKQRIRSCEKLLQPLCQNN